MPEIDYKTLVSRRGEEDEAPRETEYEILSAKDFIKKYHPGLSSEAVVYAMAQDKVDYTIPYNGRQKFIVMTPHTKSYTPINHPNRNKARA